MINKLAIIPIFISHLGCNNECVFCNQRKITGITNIPNAQSVRETIERHLKTIQADEIEIAFYGGSFTGIPVKQQLMYLEIARSYKRNNRCNRIRLSTRPDYISPEVVNRLRAYEVDLVELGCQSFNNEVLAISKRDHTVLQIYRAIELIRSVNIEVGIQLMIGLPGDRTQWFMDSVQKALALKPQTMRLYPTLVIRDTELETMYYEGTYQSMDLATAVELCARAYKLFERNGINVIRTGLQKTDLIDLGADVLAGPFHPAFGALVMSEVFYKSIEPYASKNECLEVKTHKKQTMYVKGQSGMNNQRYLISNPNLKMKIVGSDEVPLNWIEIYENNRKHLIDVMR